MRTRTTLVRLAALAALALAPGAFAQTTITQWKLAHFSAAQLMADLAADEGDPNADGTPNLLAYAFGLAPFDAAAPALPLQSLAAGRLRLSYLRVPVATDLAYVVEVSPDLRDWTADTALLSVTPLAGGLERVLVEDNAPSSLRRFIRLRVTRLTLDTNGDGLPDDWQLRYFGSVAATGDAAPLADPDGDGFANLEESAVGTHPARAADPAGAAALGLTLWTTLR